MPPEQQRNPVTQDPHRLVRCRAAPDTMWIQHHNGIFHSEKGVAGWSQIETVDPSFGFAVAVNPERPGTAWFVPATTDEEERKSVVEGKGVDVRVDHGGRRILKK